MTGYIRWLVLAIAVIAFIIIALPYNSLDRTSLIDNNSSAHTNVEAIQRGDQGSALPNSTTDIINAGEHGYSNTSPGFTASSIYIKWGKWWVSLESIKAIYNTANKELEIYVMLKTPNPCYRVEFSLSNESYVEPDLDIKVSEPPPGLYCIDLISTREFNMSMRSDDPPHNIRVKILVSSSIFETVIEVPVSGR